jgi:hypothetical protein
LDLEVKKKLQLLSEFKHYSGEQLLEKELNKDMDSKLKEWDPSDILWEAPIIIIIKFKKSKISLDHSTISQHHQKIISKEQRKP